MFQILLLQGESATNCDWLDFLSIKPHIKDVQEGITLSNRPHRPLKVASLGAVALTDAFHLLCRDTMDGIVLGFINYLMQCNWGDKINQGDDTILDLKDESSFKVIAECIF